MHMEFDTFSLRSILSFRFERVGRRCDRLRFHLKFLRELIFKHNFAKNTDLLAFFQKSGFFVQFFIVKISFYGDGVGIIRNIDGHQCTIVFQLPGLCGDDISLEDRFADLFILDIMLREDRMDFSSVSFERMSEDHSLCRCLLLFIDLKWFSTQSDMIDSQDQILQVAVHLQGSFTKNRCSFDKRVFQFCMPGLHHNKSLDIDCLNIICDPEADDAFPTGNFPDTDRTDDAAGCHLPSFYITRRQGNLILCLDRFSCQYMIGFLFALFRGFRFFRFGFLFYFLCGFFFNRWSCRNSNRFCNILLCFLWFRCPDLFLCDRSVTFLPLKNLNRFRSADRRDDFSDLLVCTFCLYQPDQCFGRIDRRLVLLKSKTA